MAQTRGARERRDGWAREIELDVRPRDIDMGHITGVARTLRTRDYVRLFFGARATANDRLRKLYCAGFLDCHAPDLAGDNCYTLTERGRDLVVDHREVDRSSLHVVKKLPAKLDHLVAINELRIHLLLASRASATYELAQFATDADLAAARHTQLLELVPDALVAVRAKATGEVHSFFAEVDLGTEAVTYLVRHKLACYAKHATLRTVLYGLRDPLVVLVVPGLRRARNIARAMDAMRVKARVVFALAPMLSEANVLGAAYALAEDLLAAASGAEAEAIFMRRLLP